MDIQYLYTKKGNVKKLVFLHSLDFVLEGIGKNVSEWTNRTEGVTRDSTMVRLGGGLFIARKE